MNWFKDCTTIAEAKKRRNELALKYHPDKGGDKKIMAEIIKQFDEFIPSRQSHDNTFENTWRNRFNGFSSENLNEFKKGPNFGRAYYWGNSQQGSPFQYHYSYRKFEQECSECEALKKEKELLENKVAEAEKRIEGLQWTLNSAMHKNAMLTMEKSTMTFNFNETLKEKDKEISLLIQQVKELENNADNILTRLKRWWNA